jgi:2-haloacid dehalogenase
VPRVLAGELAGRRECYLRAGGLTGSVPEQRGLTLRARVWLHYRVPVAAPPGWIEDRCMTDRAVAVVAFDVNETMVDMAGLRPAFAHVGLAPDLVPLWFARVLRDGFALTLVDEYRSFAEVAAQALRGLAPDLVDDAAVDAVLAAFRRLDPHPDVAPALDLLQQAGVTVVTLTNGSSNLVAALLSRAGLDRYVNANLSVDAVRRWRPAPEPYRYAADRTGVAPGRIALVACHAWDCAGAARAGLRAGWVARSEPRWPDTFPAPDVTGPDLPTVVRAILAL